MLGRAMSQKQRCGAGNEHPCNAIVLFAMLLMGQLQCSAANQSGDSSTVFPAVRESITYACAVGGAHVQVANKCTAGKTTTCRPLPPEQGCQLLLDHAAGRQQQQVCDAHENEACTTKLVRASNQLLEKQTAQLPCTPMEVTTDPITPLLLMMTCDSGVHASMHRVLFARGQAAYCRQ